ncbi:hypothetical protein ACH5RR_006953 [Cinchona calisaya]|uniref:G-protein coupled receptors family 1 profile domain-containing protein n=1 Tax=Cinchona calisaya TaxID=153742 RepID=A0ABD3AQE7_9GENT
MHRVYYWHTICMSFKPLVSNLVIAYTQALLLGQVATSFNYISSISHISWATSHLMCNFITNKTNSQLQSAFTKVVSMTMDTLRYILIHIIPRRWWWWSSLPLKYSNQSACRILLSYDSIYNRLGLLFLVLLVDPLYMSFGFHTYTK